MHSAQFLSRKDAGKYIREKFGFCSEKSLGKLACLGGGPEFRKMGCHTLYEPAKLDEWALAKIGAPINSTSEDTSRRPGSIKRGRPANTPRPLDVVEAR
jgi:hypothetical protein